jgi:hypothetical protein
MTNPLVGKAPWHNFLRVHPADLSTVDYATAFTSATWNPETGDGPNPTETKGLAWLPGQVLVAVGKHDGTPNPPPLANVPSWGKSEAVGETMLIGVFPTAR